MYRQRRRAKEEKRDHLRISRKFRVEYTMGAHLRREIKGSVLLSVKEDTGVSLLYGS